MTIRTADLLSAAARQSALELLRDHGGMEFLHPDWLPVAMFGDLVTLVDQDGLTVVGAILVESQSPGSAIVWGPAWRSTPSLDQEAQLHQAVLDHLQAGSISILQSFQSVGGDDSTMRKLGMKPISQVWTMERPASFPMADSGMLPELQFQDQGSGISPEFTRVLLNTFEESLDFPEWNGLRDAEATVQAHRNAAPDISRWWLATWRAQPAGVLILSTGSDVSRMELSYAGVDPAWRRRGIFRAIVHFALHQAGIQGPTIMELLVDERNFPAWKTYQQLGFQTVRARQFFLGSVQLK